MNLLGTWLTERMDQQLHVYQLKILIRITKVGVGWGGTGGERKTPTLLITYRRIHRPQTFALPPTEKVPGLPAAGGPRLDPQQQDVRHGAQQADPGGGHGFGEGRRHAGHLHEGQR